MTNQHISEIMSNTDTTTAEYYPDCAGCGEPVRYDQIRAYYEHEDTGEVLHVGCYEKFVEPKTEPTDK